MNEVVPRNTGFSAQSLDGLLHSHSSRLQDFTLLLLPQDSHGVVKWNRVFYVDTTLSWIDPMMVKSSNLSFMTMHHLTVLHF